MSPHPLHFAQSQTNPGPRFSVLNTLGKLREDGEWKWHASIYLLDAKYDDGLEEVNGSCRFPFLLKRGAIPVKIRHFRKIGVTPV